MRRFDFESVYHFVDGLFCMVHTSGTEYAKHSEIAMLVFILSWSIKCCSPFAPVLKIIHVSHGR